MKAFILLLIAIVIVCTVSCKHENDCEKDAKQKHPLPEDSLLVNYSGFDTLRFQVADSNSSPIDTLIFFGLGTRQHWTYGPYKWCIGPVNEQTEVVAFKYVNSKDNTKLLFLTLTAQPEEVYSSNIGVSYGSYISGTEKQADTYLIHAQNQYNYPFNEQFDTLDVLGKTYFNVRTVTKTTSGVKDESQKAYFANRGGILKIIAEPNVVWLKIP
ncbi:MAG TPA: hypothetical protein VEC12_00255 [Bacteroidia bacterium]|nr:hypothetical protein [Bacteroidia bacterium]